MLTAKQEAFCNQIAIKGKNQTDAYKAVYSSANMKDDTIINNAYKLIHLNYVATRIVELKSKITEKVIETFVYKRLDSFKVFDENIKILQIQLDEQGNPKTWISNQKDRINAIALLTKSIKDQEEQKAKLYSLYVDPKQQLDDLTKFKSITVNINYTNDPKTVEPDQCTIIDQAGEINGIET